MYSSTAAKRSSQPTVYLTDYTHSHHWILQASWSNTQTWVPSSAAISATERFNARVAGTTLTRESVGSQLKSYKNTPTISSTTDWVTNTSTHYSKSSNSLDSLTSKQQTTGLSGLAMKNARWDRLRGSSCWSSLRLTKDRRWEVIESLWEAILILGTNCALNYADQTRNAWQESTTSPRTSAGSMKPLSQTSRIKSNTIQVKPFSWRHHRQVLPRSQKKTSWTPTTLLKEETHPSSSSSSSVWSSSWSSFSSSRESTFRSSWPSIQLYQLILIRDQPLFTHRCQTFQSKSSTETL